MVFYVWADVVRRRELFQLAEGARDCDQVITAGDPARPGVHLRIHATRARVQLHGGLREGAVGVQKRDTSRRPPLQRLVRQTRTRHTLLVFCASCQKRKRGFLSCFMCFFLEVCCRCSCGGSGGVDRIALVFSSCYHLFSSRNPLSLIFFVLTRLPV